MPELPRQFTQIELAARVGISQQAVSQLIARKIVRPEESIDDATRAYCAHLREQAAGRAAAGDLDLAAERAALARAQRDKLELANAVTRRELAPLSLLEQVLGNVCAQISGILEAIPGALRRRNAALSSSDLELVADEIAKARNLAAEVRLHLADDEVAP